MDHRVVFLKNLCLQNLQKRWTTKELGAAIEISPSHLQKVFKDELGTTPIRFLTDLRLAKACELLETTFMSIKQIRYQIGITDASHFTHYFKRKYKLTPTQYRKAFWKSRTILDNQRTGSK